MKKPIIEYTKDLVERYNFTSTIGDHAKIILEIKSKGLDISISSSFGSWSYRWGNCSPQIEFLTGIDIHYLAGCFNQSHVFDLEKTIKNMHAKIIDSGRVSVLNELTELSENEDCQIEQFFIQLFYQSKELSSVYDGDYPDVEYMINPNFLGFYNMFWDEFIKAINKQN